MRRSFQIVAGGPTAGDNAYECCINGPNPMSALIDLSLPVGIRSRHVQIATGLNMHILEAGEPDGRPLILLLHGFPELASGYYVVAPDQRGYGRTAGWDDRFNGDLQSFTVSRVAIDAFALVRALGVKAVHTI